jgi:cell wall-associated NlpC family hydrolase
MRRRAPALLALVAAVAALLAGAVPAGATGSAGREAARPPARWVRVSAATLWVRPAETRRVDAPACAYPADPRAWLAGLSVAQKRWLVGRLETQALYGAKVYLLGASGAWSRIAVAGQPTPRNRWGYPGWVPTRQLTAVAPVAGTRTAVLRRPTAWLYGSAALDERVLELSYGTRLPVVSATDDAVEVARPGGGSGWLRASVVALHDDGGAWPALSGARLVAEARRFLGLQYLWAGTSGWCYDCSGFTHSVVRALGTTIPRDAGDQSRVGRRVATRGALRPGDLVFFRSASGSIHHVGMCVGDGKMIHAPATGKPVGIVSLATEPYRGEFAGGRRLTP